MFRSHHCGALRETHIGTEVTLAGWTAKVRDKGFVLWIDLRDRYGITQLVLDEERCSAALLEKARKIGRETVIQVKGTVLEREAKNPNMETGNIELLVTELTACCFAQGLGCWFATTLPNKILLRLKRLT
jgi:aspartyl-tRNA synthetase